jgi:hypothetical protein
MALPGLSWGEVAEDLAFTQAAAVVEGLDEGEDLGTGGGPVGPDARADFLLEQGPEAFGDGIVETRSNASATLPDTQPLYSVPELSRGVLLGLNRSLQHRISGPTCTCFPPGATSSGISDPSLQVSRCPGSRGSFIAGGRAPFPKPSWASRHGLLGTSMRVRRQADGPSCKIEPTAYPSSSSPITLENGTKPDRNQIALIDAQDRSAGNLDELSVGSVVQFNGDPSRGRIV